MRILTANDATADSLVNGLSILPEHLFLRVPANYRLLEVSLLTDLWNSVATLNSFLCRFNELSFPAPNICNSPASLAFCIIHSSGNTNRASPPSQLQLQLQLHHQARFSFRFQLMHGHRSSAVSGLLLSLVRIVTRMRPATYPRMCRRDLEEDGTLSQMCVDRRGLI